MNPSQMKLFQGCLNVRNQKRPDFSDLNPSVGKDYSRELLLFIGRRAEAEASDRLVLVVDSSEASIEVDPTPLKRN